MRDDFQNQYITTGSENPLLPQLEEGIASSTDIYIAVSFIRYSGMNLLKKHLFQALNQGKNIKILTSNYMRLTEPKALELLLELKDFGADVRVYEAVDTGFHMKAYLFLKKDKNQSFPNGHAFVGSSNISDAALLKSVEWNIRVDLKENPGRFITMLEEFDKLFLSPPTCELTLSWLHHYQKKWLPDSKIPEITRPKIPDALTQNPKSIPEPNDLQIEVLSKLEAARENGVKRGLVVLATGLGKTWLSAFDSHAMHSKRILFIAHRQEILQQAQETFEKIYPGFRTGVYQGKNKELDAAIIFASIQSLGKKAHLERFLPDHFDYIVIDEFHHSAAKSYQKLLNYFEPKFLLGLTATPERTDQADILDFCDGNEICRVDLFEGINRALLCPFHYFGIEDKYVDYTRVAWRQGKFVEQALELELNTQRRAHHIYDQWLAKRQTKTLAFCLSKKHAEFMADYFRQRGINTAAIHSSSEINRVQGLEGLSKGIYPIIFTVDLFNEGVDIPEIDTVMMLRPTESKILFLQQLGRGLRRVLENSEKKLHVLDFIGNHHVFLNKPQALFGLNPTHKEVSKLVSDYKHKCLKVPTGCEVYYDLEVIEFFQQLSQPKSSNQIEATYQELKENKGRRPTATEMFQAGVSFTRLRQGWGSWFDFINTQMDLNPEELACFKQQSAFLSYLETTKMTRSFKMITIEAFLQLKGFNHPPDLERLSDLGLRVLHRRGKLRREVPDDYRDIHQLQYLSESQMNQWRKFWKKNPIKALTGGFSLKEKPYFTIDKNCLSFKPDIDAAYLASFEDMVHELIAYRLFRYEPKTKEQKKILTFNADHISTSIKGTIDLSPVLHQSFMREDIPSLFGLEFNRGLWHSGHVCPKGKSFQILLVTLVKAGKVEAHRYHDYFIDTKSFYWQSQSKTTPQSSKGKRLKEHGKNHEQIFLFVRRTKLDVNNKAASFTYCGELEFSSWEGSQPINTIWNLKSPMPKTLLDEFQT